MELLYFITLVGGNYMAVYSDEELLFLSNLMYMKQETKLIKSPFENVWIEENTKKGVTVGAVISKINTSDLRKEPLKDFIFDGEISGYEWADMIDAMKKSDICELKLKDVKRDDKNALSTYFTDKQGNAYVVFRGTGGGEWEDNFLGGSTSDTQQQKRALEYINSIDAEHITVVGHSKGGNKAKYVALLSDKVDRCVSFDGQGFSEAFMENNKGLIIANKYKITCYALENDFVNILLNDVYNKKYYIKGNGVDSFVENHSPNSFFDFIYKKGKVVGYELNVTSQSATMKDLHSFVNYIASSIPDKDRESFFSFLGQAADKALGKKPSEYIDEYTTEDILKYLSNKENSDELGLLVAYILEYEEYNEGITDAVFDIMEQSGLETLADWLRKLEDKIGAEKLLKNVLKYSKQIDWLLNKLKVPEDIRNIIKNMAEGYERRKGDVKNVNSESIADYDLYANANVRDYSQNKRDLLLKLTDSVANEKAYDVRKWDIWYRFEDWFGLLDIEDYKNDIDRYYEKVIDINGTSHKQMIQIFDKVDRVITDYKKVLTEASNKLDVLNKKVLWL
jgi:dienelactone hydrolase